MCSLHDLKGGHAKINTIPIKVAVYTNGDDEAEAVDGQRVATRIAVVLIRPRDEDDAVAFVIARGNETACDSLDI